MDPLSVHFFSDHITLTSIPASQRRTIRRSRPLFNWLTQEPHLASSRQWCPSPWVSQLCFCGAFWPAGACTLLLLAPPTSRGRPLCMGYVPLGFRAGQSVNNIRFNCKKKKKIRPHWFYFSFLPSGGSKAFGPVGWNPVMAQSIICLLSISTDLEVSVSSLSGQAMKTFPARLLAACGKKVKSPLNS